MENINQENNVDEKSVEYWKRRALNAELEVDILHQKISTIPDRMIDFLGAGIKVMINNQILKPKKVYVKGEEVQVKKRRYTSGHTRLVLVDKEGQDLLEVSVDRPDIKLESNEIVLCTRKENNDVIYSLQKAGVFNFYMKQLDDEHCIASIHV